MIKQLTVEARLRISNTRLKNENKKLREENKFLKEKVSILEAQVENMSLQIKELQTIIFGKKKNKDDDDQFFGGSSKEPKLKIKRDNSSYRRAVSSESEITKEETHTIDICPDCGSFLVRKRFVTRYVEDILLPYLDKLSGLIRAPGKEVIKEHIEKGWCKKCKCWHEAKPHPNSPPVKNNEVILGENVKLLVNFKTYVIRETVTQIQDELRGLYSLSISKGEIINMLDKTAVNLKPEFQRLLKRIQTSPAVHMDETSWQTKAEKTFAWVMAPVNTEEAVFVVGKTRGKGVAENLLGKDWSGVKITDCYGAYKNLPGDHQVCWAHIIRKARDLSQNQSLEANKRLFANNIYQELQKIYHELKVAIQKGIGKHKLILKFKQKVTASIKAILKFKDAPKKLTDLAKLMNKYLDELFTCLKYDNIPAENNKAEQKLRHLILKRKNSFGTKTEKGNETFSTNASVLLSLWWYNKTSFWPKFRELVRCE